ncbi:MAG: hypothetical protein INR68_06225 [Methylobacterium mesophilicum]|nr:hypothetical protein [Methylobacterium mesophilicum]
MTISDRTLRYAVERGVISADQLTSLRAIEDERVAREPSDDEKLRFITGFGDIFVTIGIGLFLSAIGWFTEGPLGLGGMALVIAAASWLLAEFFTRRRRMALPSIVLLITFATGVFTAVLAYGSGQGAISFWQFNLLPGSQTLPPWIVLGAALVTVLAAALHYWRFRVPITVAAGVAALGTAVLAFFTALAPEFVVAWLRPILFVLGILVFALAMRFDLSDPARATRRTDIAFWLHMIAAPLIVHPLVRGITIEGTENAGSAWAVLAIFAVLALIALLVDRRAVLVAGLSYAGIALGSLLSGTVLADNIFPLSMLVLGALVLLLSAGWHGLRRRLLGALPQGLAARLPETPHGRFH